MTITTEQVTPTAQVQALLKVEGLAKHFPTSSGNPFNPTRGAIKAVDGVSFELGRGQTLGLVGESGCGKSTTGRMIARLLEPTSGTIELGGQDLSTLKGKELVHFRRKIQMIFQDPFSSLNPRQTVGTAIATPLRTQGIKPPEGMKARVQDLMDRVGLKPEHYNRFPHEFSGGQRQRIGIARAIALKPEIIVCDEPVSALDVSVQAQVVNLLMDIQADTGVSYVFIAHDLSVVKHISDRIAVMYLGKVAEQGTVEQLFSEPRHPYTKALLSAVPIPDPRKARAMEKIRLVGDLPSPANPPSGCVFRTRCPLYASMDANSQEKCRTQAPPVAIDLTPACHFA